MPDDIPLDAAKFRDPLTTARGETRAWVDFIDLKTLWFNTGSLCNIACTNCYMDSNPKNDRLAYLSLEDVERFLDQLPEGAREIGFTGGEPFMNKALPAMLTAVLDRGLDALVLTNAMAPLQQKMDALLELKGRTGLTLRVSLDHHTQARHDAVRGEGAWDKTIAGLLWLRDHDFDLAVAGRTCWDEDEAMARAGYAAAFEDLGLPIDAAEPSRLVLFPEMDETKDVPEITTACWDLLGKRPDAMMCATSRMVVKRKGEDAPVVTPCTLLPYDGAFDMGATMTESFAAVRLNHPHCARFCVLGGASCSA